LNDERFDLEGELHEGRARPRSEFVASLAEDVRGRARRSRVGLMLAMAGLVIVAVASFGGIGYAASNTSASAQYAPYTPKHTAMGNKAVQSSKQSAAKAPAATKAPTATSSELPFTGLALWVPLAIGLMLIAFGVIVRTRARRHGARAR
jgi:hypothetical protein